MPDFINPRILTLDEVFEYLDEVYKEAILQENIERYIILLSNFINQYHDSDKIKNLKSNQYTVEARNKVLAFYYL